jgi:hypothetical protein
MFLHGRDEQSQLSTLHVTDERAARGVMADMVAALVTFVSLAVDYANVRRGEMGPTSHTGMTPRFFAGRSIFLWRASSRPHAIARRVSRGSITSSTRPHPATL